MAKADKDVWINLRVNLLTREEFRAAAHLRGASMSTLLHQYIVKIVREEKERSLEGFNKALEFVRKAGADPEGNMVYGSAVFAGGTELTGNLTNITPAKQEEVSDFDVGQAEETPEQRKNRETRRQPKGKKAGKKRA